MEKNKKNISRIALIGPESTGKSTLAQKLAAKYNTAYVPEYARSYIAELQRPYTIEDILLIAQAQLKQEKKLLSQANSFLFIDTEFIVAKIWSEDVFKSCPPWIEKQIEKHKYDVYLLTYPDIPWVADPLRENENRRDYFFNLYVLELKAHGLPYKIIRGTGDERMINAINALKVFE